MNKKVMLLIPVLIGIMFVLPLLSAATMTTPVTGGNYTTSPFVVTVTVPGNGANNMTNVTCYYNSSGGAATTQFLQILNTTSSQTTFTGSATMVTDSRTYNISCKVQNGTTLNTTVSTASVTIEGGLPTASVTLESEYMATRSSNLITWASADSLSGLASTVTTIVSPDTGRCPTITYTTSSGSVALVDDKSSCSGTYTVTTTATDYSGNQKVATKTFRASSSGLNKQGSNTLGGNVPSQFSQGQEINSVAKPLPLGESGTNVAILIILGCAAYLFFKRK